MIVEKWLCLSGDGECKSIVYVPGKNHMSPFCPVCGSSEDMDCLGEHNLKEEEG